LKGLPAVKGLKQFLPFPFSLTNSCPKKLPDIKGLRRRCSNAKFRYADSARKGFPTKGLKMLYAPYPAKKYMLPAITKLQFSIVPQKTSHPKCSPQKNRMTTPVIERVYYGSIN